MKLSAVILAGGQSLRMGRDKAWLEVEGQPLLRRTGETVRALGVEEIFISGRAGADYSALKLPVLIDLESGGGPLGGIERGLDAASSPLLLVLAVDLPQMTTAFLEKLFAGCDSQTGAVPQLAGGLEPLAAIYPKRCHAIAVQCLAGGRLAAREFAVACLRENAVKLFPVAASDAALFANCNTPDDLPPKSPRSDP